MVSRALAEIPTKSPISNDYCEDSSQKENLTPSQSFNSSCLTEISNISHQQVGQAKIHCTSTFQVGRKYRVITTSVKSKNLKEKSKGGEDLYLILVCPTDKWDDINGLVEEAMRNATNVERLPDIGEEVIVRDNPFSGVKDLGYRRGTVIEADIVKLNKDEHRLVMQIDTGKKIMVRKSRIYNLPESLKQFEKNLWKRVLVNSVEGLENGQCKIIEVLEKRTDAYYCRVLNENDEKSRALDLIEQLRKSVNDDNMAAAKEFHQALTAHFYL